VIEIRSSPDGAEITLDGSPTGLVTPQVLKNLRVDRTYQVKLSFEGYRHEIREVKLSASQPLETVSLELRPASKGIITIKTTPAGARIFFDGRDIDEPTPTTIAEIVPLEEHTILVKLDNYVDMTKTVSVAPGEVLELPLILEETPLGPNEAFLVIESVPTEAQITLNGKVIDARTPHTLRLIAGERVTVEVNKSGFRTFQQRLPLTSGETHTIRAELERTRDTGGGGDQVAGTGRLYFNAIPYCNVTIDGRPYGVTPLVGVEIPAGRHTIRCSSPPIGVTKTVPVNIPPNGTVRHQIKLSP
jgi:serine/threonine-protein kinase